MFANARPAVSSRPWIAAGVALALMLSLAAAIAPAVAETQPDNDGAVAFVGEPSLEPDGDNLVSITVTVDGRFPVPAAVLAARVEGIVVTFELFNVEADEPEPVVDATTVETDEGAPPSATGVLDFSSVPGGHYTVVATARLEPSGYFLDSASTGTLAYLPGGEQCENCEAEPNGGVSATLVVAGGGLVALDVLDPVEESTNEGTDPYNFSTLECAGDHTRLPRTLLFDIIPNNVEVETATLTVTLNKDARQTTTNNGVSQYQFCYIGGAPFDDRFESPADEPADGFAGFPKLTHGPALLPECSANGDTAPCVLDRTSIRGGGAQFTFLVPTGDPMFR